jgi:hypothetical protein
LNTVDDDVTNTACTLKRSTVYKIASGELGITFEPLDFLRTAVHIFQLNVVDVQRKRVISVTEIGISVVLHNVSEAGSSVPKATGRLQAPRGRNVTRRTYGVL